KEYIYHIFCFYLYNLGLVFPSMIYSTLINPSRIPIKESTFFNFQGMNNSVFTFPPLIAILFVFLFQFITTLKLGFTIIGILGFGGILSYKVWLNLILKKFNKNKYKIAQNLRGQYS
ncbi:DUF5687 family protein, partial [bacterium]|nr:DUF5687 family protein [bacterium]